MAWARHWESVGIRVREDVVLSAIKEVVEVSVFRGREGALEHLYDQSISNCTGTEGCRETYVIVLPLEPVERLFRAVGAVAGRSVRLSIGRIRTATAGDLRLCDRHVRRRARDVAAESVHVV